MEKRSGYRRLKESLKVNGSIFGIADFLFDVA